MRRLARMRFHADDHRNALAYAFRHDTEVLEQVQAAPHALRITGGNLGKDLDVNRTDAKAISRVANQFAPGDDAQRFEFDVCLVEAEDET